jgi:hypothetical protein
MTPDTTLVYSSIPNAPTVGVDLLFKRQENHSALKCQFDKLLACLQRTVYLEWMSSTVRPLPSDHRKLIRGLRMTGRVRHRRTSRCQMGMLGRGPLDYECKITGDKKWRSVSI